MKIKGNQVFKTLDFLTLVFGFIAVGAVAGPMLSDAFRGNEQAKVQVESETLAKKLLKSDWANSVNTAGLPSNSSRSPASITGGTVSLNQRDPWGFPYHYKLAKGPDGNGSFIVVWSAGPDHVSDSDSVEVKFDGGRPVAVFKNDDEGSVVSTR